jgi:hypothetical protein
MTDHPRASVPNLAIILLVLAILRLLLVIPAYQQPLEFTEVDSFQYLELAQGMRSRGEYRGDTEGVDLLRPPGYPLFLWLGLAIGNGALNSVPLLQLLLVFFSAAFLYSGPVWNWVAEKLGLSPRFALFDQSKCCFLVFDVAH